MHFISPQSFDQLRKKYCGFSDSFLKNVRTKGYHNGKLKLLVIYNLPYLSLCFRMETKKYLE